MFIYMLRTSFLVQTLTTKTQRIYFYIILYKRILYKSDLALKHDYDKSPRDLSETFGITLSHSVLLDVSD